MGLGNRVSCYPWSNSPRPTSNVPSPLMRLLGVSTQRHEELKTQKARHRTVKPPIYVNMPLGDFSLSSHQEGFLEVIREMSFEVI